MSKYESPKKDKSLKFTITAITKRIESEYESPKKDKSLRFTITAITKRMETECDADPENNEVMDTLPIEMIKTEFGEEGETTQEALIDDTVEKEIEFLDIQNVKPAPPVVLNLNNRHSNPLILPPLPQKIPKPIVYKRSCGTKEESKIHNKRQKTTYRFQQIWTEMYGVVDKDLPFCVLCKPNQYVIAKTTAPIRNHFENRHKKYLPQDEIERLEFIAKIVAAYREKLKCRNEAIKALNPISRQMIKTEFEEEEEKTTQEVLIDDTVRKEIEFLDMQNVKPTPPVVLNLNNRHSNPLTLPQKIPKPIVYKRSCGTKEEPKIHNKRRKIRYRFQQIWTEMYGIVEKDNLAFCVLCKPNQFIAKTTAPIRTHFENRHKKYLPQDEIERLEFIAKIVAAYREKLKCRNEAIKALNPISRQMINTEFEEEEKTTQEVLIDDAVGKEIEFLDMQNVKPAPPVILNLNNRHSNPLTLPPLPQKIHNKRRKMRYRFQQIWTEMYGILDKHLPLCVLCEPNKYVIAKTTAPIRTHFENRHKKYLPQDEIERLEFIAKIVAAYREKHKCRNEAIKALNPKSRQLVIARVDGNNSTSIVQETPQNTEKVVNTVNSLLPAVEKESPAVKQKGNECEVFGLLVARKLEKYNSNIISTVQEEIMQILFKADKGHFDNEEFSSTEGDPDTTV